jgi:hypothetical protein
MSDERHSPNALTRSPPSPTLERPWALTTHDKRHYKQDVARHFTMIRGKKILMKNLDNCSKTKIFHIQANVFLGFVMQM